MVGDAVFPGGPVIYRNGRTVTSAIRSGNR